ncbi:hypothetical protein U6A24_08010 [Aquimarina gracilis]|uniref:Uncharacterized protein n=1 Tax=Aquimarina gracilis TaxID=874422 RepID=A0ABU5ZV85_9FLAO|nr:hypothetical protein [Aquimarina gracilis]MEB3345397.1 hypothetical protein [Aquimarina gracilis]
MASKNNNENSNLRNADTVICECLTGIKNEKKAAGSMRDAYKILKKSKKAARRYKVCGLDKAEESHGVYQDIMSCVAIGSSKKTEVIQTNINEYNAKDDQIEALIKESSKLLNQMRIKIEEANDAACALSNCFKNKILPKSGKSKKDDEKEEAYKKLQDILEKTTKLNEKGQNAHDSVITIAGIQTFTNTHSLTEFMTKTSTAMSGFKSTVESNISSTSEDVTKCREELNVIADELAQIVCNKKTESVKYEGLECVIDYVCKGEYKEDPLDLCRETTDCYDSHHGERYDQRKKDRRQKRQTKDMD